MRRLADPEALGLLLARGGIVLLPTDTLPGLHARGDAGAAVARLLALKRRAPDKPLLLLCASAEEALALAAPLAPAAGAWARRCWPGPFTLVLPRGPAAPDAVCAGGPTVACRVPDAPALRAVIAAAGFPLASTSANRTGEPPCADLEEAARRFGDLVDAVAQGLLPDARPGQRASALLDLSVWPPRCLRDGPLPPPSWEETGGPGPVRT